MHSPSDSEEEPLGKDKQKDDQQENKKDGSKWKNKWKKQEESLGGHKSCWMTSLI